MVQSSNKTYIFYRQISIYTMSNIKQNKQNHPQLKKKLSKINQQFHAPHLFEDKYISAKLDVFYKYRQKQTPLRVLEVLATDKQLLEQKNLIFLHCRHQIIPFGNVESSKPRIRLKIAKNEEDKRGDIRGLRQMTKGSCSLKSLSNIFKSYEQSKQESLSDIQRNLKSFSTRISTENINSRRYESCSSSVSQRHTNINLGIIKIDDTQIESLK